MGYHIKNGTVTNYVDEDMFNRVYKPAGWVIDPAFHQVPQDEQKRILEVKGNETELKNYNKMKKAKSTKKVFNDKIIKGK